MPATDIPLDVLERLWLSIQDYEHTVDAEGPAISATSYEKIDNKLDAINDIVSQLHKHARYLLP